LKKGIFIAILTIALCLLMLSGTVYAAYAGYSHICHNGTDITVDGQWTTSSEWNDGEPTWFGNQININFRDKYAVVSDGTTFSVYEDIIVESNDATNDIGDYFQVCFDGNFDGGSAPQTDDFMLNYTGHTTASWYQGTGSGWAAIAAPGNVAVAQQLIATPTSSTPHYVLEMRITKTSTPLALGQEFGMRLAFYDAHTGGAGLQAWPPTSPNVPNDWGDIPYTSEVYTPDNLSIALVIALSSIAVIVSAVGLKKTNKNSKTNNT